MHANNKRTIRSLDSYIYIFFKNIDSDTCDSDSESFKEFRYQGINFLVHVWFDKKDNSANYTKKLEK